MRGSGSRIEGLGRRLCPCSCRFLEGPVHSVVYFGQFWSKFALSSVSDFGRSKDLGERGLWVGFRVVWSLGWRGWAC